MKVIKRQGKTLIIFLEKSWTTCCAKTGEDISSNKKYFIQEQDLDFLGRKEKLQIYVSKTEELNS